MLYAECPKCNWRTMSQTPITTKCSQCNATIVIEGESNVELDILNPVFPEVASSNSKDQGRAAWTALHTMQQPTPDKLTTWLDTVPSYSCKCREFATQYIKDSPPPYDDQAAFFEWGWRFHDAVDQKTGDQRMTLDEAKGFWHQIGTN